jgi:hypothetical protein
MEPKRLPLYSQKSDICLYTETLQDNPCTTTPTPQIISWRSTHIKRKSSPFSVTYILAIQMFFCGIMHKPDEKNN